MVVCRCNDDVPTLPTSIGMNWHVIVERQHLFDEEIDNRDYLLIMARKLFLTSSLVIP